MIAVFSVCYSTIPLQIIINIKTHLKDILENNQTHETCRAWDVSLSPYTSQRLGVFSITKSVAELVLSLYEERTLLLLTF